MVRVMFWWQMNRMDFCVLLAKQAAGGETCSWNAVRWISPAAKCENCDENFPDEINYKWPNLSDTRWIQMKHHLAIINHNNWDYVRYFINTLHAQSVYFDPQLHSTAPFLDTRFVTSSRCRCPFTSPSTVIQNENRNTEEKIVSQLKSKRQRKRKKTLRNS